MTHPRGVAQAGLLLALLLLPSVSYADRRLEEALVVTTAAADTILTEYALSQDGFSELNPLMQNQAGRIALKAGTTALTLFLARKLEGAGKPGYAKALRWTSITVWGGATAWNIHISF